MPLLGKIDGFLVSMLAAVLLALTWPALGAGEGAHVLESMTAIGIALVFFLHGANLAPSVLRSGAVHWRLHVMIQGTTFLLFPLFGGLLWIATRQLFPESPLFPEGLRLGFFFLAALPSTISSSIAMTALARGNVAVAIFNATLSGLIGMLVTPLLIGLVTSAASHGTSNLDAILAIARALLLPFALGQLCRPLIGGLIARNKRLFSLLDRCVILLIVFTSFCESTRSGLWRHFSPLVLLGVAALACVMLIGALCFARVASRMMGLSRADEAAAVFCASKKSLATGAPMAKLLFAGNPSLGMIMLPVLLYHQIQLIICAQLARRYAAETDVETGHPREMIA